MGGIAIDIAGNIWGADPFGFMLFNEFSPVGCNRKSAHSRSIQLRPQQFENEKRCRKGPPSMPRANVWITSGQGFTKESKSTYPRLFG